jgi:hypothetical protein
MMGKAKRDFFGEYILARKITETPAGDFIRDARDDPHFPRGVRTWGELRSYLESERACDDAIRAAYAVWRAFRQRQRRDAAMWEWLIHNRLPGEEPVLVS